MIIDAEFRLYLPLCGAVRPVMVINWRGAGNQAVVFQGKNLYPEILTLYRVRILTPENLFLVIIDLDLNHTYLDSESFCCRQQSGSFSQDGNSFLLK